MYNKNYYYIDNVKRDYGDYWKDIDNIWYALTPNGFYISLKLHNVVENKDGTITVSPSIGVGDNNEKYHGYLENGKWRDC